MSVYSIQLSQENYRLQDDTNVEKINVFYYSYRNQSKGEAGPLTLLLRHLYCISQEYSLYFLRMSSPDDDPDALPSESKEGDEQKEDNADSYTLMDYSTPISAAPPKVILQEEGQVEVAASPAFQCLDDVGYYKIFVNCLHV